MSGVCGWCTGSSQLAMALRAADVTVAPGPRRVSGRTNRGSAAVLALLVTAGFVVPAAAAPRLERHDVALAGRLVSWVVAERGGGRQEILALLATTTPGATPASDPAAEGEVVADRARRTGTPVAPLALPGPVVEPAGLTLVRIGAGGGSGEVGAAPSGGVSGGAPAATSPLRVTAIARLERRGGEELVALDLDGDGADELLVASRGRGPGSRDRPGMGEVEPTLDELVGWSGASPRLVPRLAGAFARVDARVAPALATAVTARAPAPWCAARAGTVRCYGPGADGDWRVVGAWPLPISVARRGRRLEISSPAVAVLPAATAATALAARAGVGGEASAEAVGGSDAAASTGATGESATGSPVAGTSSAAPGSGWEALVGPQAFGGRRLRVEAPAVAGAEPSPKATDAEVADTEAADTAVASLERWARLPGPELVLEAKLLRGAAGDALLVVLTADRTRMNVFGKQLLRVFRLAADRTRSGSPPLVALETPFYRWSPVELTFADYDGDGLTDLLLAGSKGLGGGELELWRLSGRRDGGFAPLVRAELDAPGVRWSLDGDVDGDGRHDLVTVSRGQLAVRRGLATGSRPIDRQPLASLVLDVRRREEVRVAVGTAGGSVERGEVRAEEGGDDESESAAVEGEGAGRAAAGAPRDADDAAGTGEVDEAPPGAAASSAGAADGAEDAAGAEEAEEEEGSGEEAEDGGREDLTGELAGAAEAENRDELEELEDLAAALDGVAGGLSVLDLDGDGQHEILDIAIGGPNEPDVLRMVWLRPR